MIRVEKGTCDIKTSEGVPGLTADLAVIVRALKKDTDGEVRSKRS